MSARQLVVLERIRRVQTSRSGWRWIYPFGAAIVLWLIGCAVAGRLTAGLLLDNVTLASFVGLPAVGQMMVVASGDGSFDLSIPYVMTLAGYVSAAITAGGRHMVLGLLAGVLIGVVAGVLNGALVVGPGLPPIVATLATGYIGYTFAMLIRNGAEVAVTSGLAGFSRSTWHGLTFVVPIGVIIWAAVAVLRGQTPYGQYLHAMGQNRTAAMLAGVPVKRMVMSTFVLSGTLSALGGILLAGYVGGAFMDMSTPYLIASVAAIVVGGTSVRGGESAIVATVFGALTMMLLTATLELSGIGTNVQDIAEGAVIIVVVMGVSHTFSRR